MKKWRLTIIVALIVTVFTILPVLADDPPAGGYPKLLFEVKTLNSGGPPAGGYPMLPPIIKTQKWYFLEIYDPKSYTFLGLDLLVPGTMQDSDGRVSILIGPFKTKGECDTNRRWFEQKGGSITHGCFSK